MDTLFFAKVIGLYALIEGTSMFVARPALIGAFRDGAKHRTVSYLTLGGYLCIQAFA